MDIPVYQESSQIWTEIIFWVTLEIYLDASPLVYDHS